MANESANTKSTSKPILSVKEMAITALMTAVICILGPWALNIPISPVPISLCSMGIYFVLSVLGIKLGTISVLLYVLLGAVGLPVFSNFSGGFGKLTGPTGGYIIGYLFLALIVLYAFGTFWLKVQTGMTFPAALMAGVIPYIPGDIVKLILAMALGYPLKAQLKKAGLI